jgi:hypothetical protein
MQLLFEVSHAAAYQMVPTITVELDVVLVNIMAVQRRPRA